MLGTSRKAARVLPRRSRCHRRMVRAPVTCAGTPCAELATCCRRISATAASASGTATIKAVRPITYQPEVGASRRQRGTPESAWASVHECPPNGFGRL
jgi:hypothetical protein